MTRLTKWLTAITVAVAAACALIVTTRPVQAASTNTDVTLTIHKRLYHNRNELPTISNDGAQLDSHHAALADSVGLNGIHMTVFDATDYLNDFEGGLEQFIKVYGNGDITAAAMARVAAEQGMATTADMTTATDTATGEEGVGRATLQRTRNDGQPTAYFVVEDEDSAAAEGVDATALPGMLVVPGLYQMSSNTLHMYPKNVAYQRDPYFFKIGRQANGNQNRLAGAQFVIRRRNGDGWDYLAANQPNLQRLAWVQSSDPTSDDQVHHFESRADGLVTTGEIMFPAGNYQWVEVKAPDGFKMLTDPVSMVVPTSKFNADGSYNPVLINGQTIPRTVDGNLTSSIIDKGQPYVYNDAKTTETPGVPGTGTTGGGATTPQTPQTGKPTAKAAGILPQLGLGLSTLAVAVGLIMIALGLYWRHHARRAAMAENHK